MKGQCCQKGLWDATVPGISFNEDGVSNYYRIYNNYEKLYPKGEKGLRDWLNIVDKIKRDGRNKKYDCIIGVSGGTDSSYLLHLAVQQGLRPLAVFLDNGWASDISVKNIKTITNALNIDLETYVINYDEMKDILRAYIRSSLPWIDYPTDHAIKSILFKMANKEKLKYILIGHDFRCEGIQPNEWTYGDSRQLKYIQKKFGTVKLKSFPNMTLPEQAYYALFKKISMIYPYFYIPYSKQDAKIFLTKNYGWQDYGGHHYENRFTKFAIAYWMYSKFNMDKRIISLSAQVLNREISREEAMAILAKKPYDMNEIESDKLYVIKKLGMTIEEFENCWKKENWDYRDYPSYNTAIETFRGIIKPFVPLLFAQKPAYFVQLDVRKEKQK